MEGLAESIERRLQLQDERLAGACTSEREYTLLVLPLLRFYSSAEESKRFAHKGTNVLRPLSLALSCCFLVTLYVWLQPSVNILFHASFARDEQRAGRILT